MPFKITLRYRFLLSGLQKLKNFITHYWQFYEEAGTGMHSWWEHPLVQPRKWATWQYRSVLKMHVPIESIILLLGIYHSDRLTLGQDGLTRY